MLSSTTMLAPATRTAVMNFLVSSGSLGSGPFPASRPVATTLQQSARSPFPVPGVVASITCSGVGPVMSSRRKGRSIKATAFARLPGLSKGKSQTTSARSSAAAIMSLAVGRSGMPANSRSGAGEYQSSSGVGTRGWSPPRRRARAPGSR